MKKVLKIIGSIFAILYAIVVIIITTCLLNYNDYKITVFNNKSLIIVNDDALDGTYKKGSLLVVKKNVNNINVGDDIIFYNTYNNQVSLAVGEVLDVEKNVDDLVYTLNGNYDIISENVIGSTKDTKVIPVIGGIMGLLESRIGFLVFIIFPITIAFLYEVCVLILEIKSSDKESDKKETKEKSKEIKE